MQPAVLRAQGIDKAFNGHVALKDVSLCLRAGEIHSLMGENGAGKSTLIKVLTGIYRQDSGNVYLGDETVSPKSNYEAQHLGIATVFQEVNLIPTLSVAENIYLGREPIKWGRIDWKAMRIGARTAMRRLDLDLDVSRPLEDYSIAAQQMTAIARALDQSAKVLILDEATSSLDRSEVQRLFAVLKRLRSEGMAILFVSHFFDQVYEISDRITVLRNGEFIGEFGLNELDRSSLVAKMMGRELTELNSLTVVNAPSLTSPKPWLKCENLGSTGQIEPFALSFNKGEIVGLAGLLGSGRSEIAKLLFGLLKKTSGTIKIDQKNVRIDSPRAAIRHGLALCPEDRKNQAVFPQLSVQENILLALQARRGWWRKLSRKKSRLLTEHYINTLKIRARNADQPIETLSGGNQQKVILARWLALNPRLLILDEPTRGIDVGAKAEIQKYIHELTVKGQSSLFISSELEEIVRLCGRIAVLKDHRKIAELVDQQISESSIMAKIGEAP